MLVILFHSVPDDFVHLGLQKLLETICRPSGLRRIGNWRLKIDAFVILDIKPKSTTTCCGMLSWSMSERAPK